MVENQKENISAVKCGEADCIVCVHEKDQQFYVAKVQEIDKDDMTLDVSFNSRAHVIYWLTRPDLIWVKRKFFLVVTPPLSEETKTDFNIQEDIMNSNNMQYRDYLQCQKK